jgi:hypothetical protein
MNWLGPRARYVIALALAVVFALGAAFARNLRPTGSAAQ